VVDYEPEVDRLQTACEDLVVVRLNEWNRRVAAVEGAERWRNGKVWIHKGGADWAALRKGELWDGEGRVRRGCEPSGESDGGRVDRRRASECVVVARPVSRTLSHSVRPVNRGCDRPRSRRRHSLCGREHSSLANAVCREGVAGSGRARSEAGEGRACENDAVGRGACDCLEFRLARVGVACRSE